MGSIVGRLILFGYTWALMHHMLGGIRHLIWDTGRGFEPREREWLAVATLVGSISLTIVHLGRRLPVHGRVALMVAGKHEHPARARARPRAPPDPAPSISGASA